MPDSMCGFPSTGKNTWLLLEHSKYHPIFTNSDNIFLSYDDFTRDGAKLNRI